MHSPFCILSLIGEAASRSIHFHKNNQVIFISISNHGKNTRISTLFPFSAWKILWFSVKKSEKAERKSIVYFR